MTNPLVKFYFGVLIFIVLLCLSSIVLLLNYSYFFSCNVLNWISITKGVSIFFYLNTRQFVIITFK